jgi:uncharacterized damage-inducible protein DinB
MGAVQVHSDIRLLLNLIDQAYEKKAWHGPNLRGSLRGLTAAQAAWRPEPQRRSIAEIVLHAAYWKYIVRRRLRGDKRGSFELKGSNWFPVPAPLTETTWRQYLQLLERAHRDMRAVVAELPHQRLGDKPGGSKVSNAAIISGIAAHDLYHTGQIQLLKRLQKSEVRSQRGPSKVDL